MSFWNPTEYSTPNFWDRIGSPSLNNEEITSPLENSFSSFWDKLRNKVGPTTGSSLRSLGSSLYNLSMGGPTTRSVEGQGAFTDLNRNQVWDQGENYDPSSSVWNGWMSAQDAKQTPTTPTSAGTGYVPQTQEQQDFQNALTMGEYSGDPLSQEEKDQYAALATPKHNWKTEKAAGNDWLGDLF